MSSSSFSGPKGLPQNCLKVAIGLVLAAAAAGAHSAEPKEETSLPKIVVQDEAPAPSNKVDELSSPKFTQPLLDTPQTITVVSNTLLKQQGARTLTQALRNIPGVTFQLGENGNTSTGDSLFLRGFDTQGSIFVDGIRDLGAVSRDVFNIEQVEVAKGPSGADYGRGAASGYVNLASKVPVNDSFMSSDVSYGTADNSRVTGDWNQSFNSGSAAVRVNVMGQEGGVDGRDFVEDETWALAPSVAFGLGSNTRTYFNLLTSKQKRRPDGGVPTIGQDGYSNSALGNLPNPAAPDSENYYGFLNDFDDVKSTMFTARIEHDFSSTVRLRNSSRYGKKEQDYQITGVNNIFPNANPSLSTVERRPQGRHQENTILTNQTNVNADFKAFGLSHSLASGFEVIYEKQFSPTIAVQGTVPNANLYDPNRRDPTTGFTLARNGVRSEGETTTVALYAFDTISLTEKWQLTAGLRLDNYDTQFNGVTASTAATQPGLPVGTLVPERIDKSDILTSYKVGLLYKPAANGSVYVSHATSQQPPGGANFTLNSNAVSGNNALNRPNVDPQKGSNVELGTKWDFRDGKLGVTAALFNSENKNDLVQPDPTDPMAVVQSGKKRVKGIELGIVGQLTDAWQISAGVTKQDTKVIDGQVTAAVGTTAAVNQNGQPINFSPELTFTSWTTYSWPFGLTVGGGIRYVDSQTRSLNGALDATNRNLSEIPSYFVIDAAIGYGITERVSVQLNLYNLTDEDYLDQVNNSGQRYIPGRPLSGVLSVAVGL